MTRVIQLFVLIACSSLSYGQIHMGEHINDMDSTSALDIQSSNDGILIPSFTTEERKALLPPNNDWQAWEGMLVYDKTLKALAYVHDGKWRILKNN